MPEDYTPRNYQDDVDTGSTETDPVQDERSDQPAQELGIPYSAYAEEFNDPEGFSERGDDQRESIEDDDEDGDDGTKAA